MTSNVLTQQMTELDLILGEAPPGTLKHERNELIKNKFRSFAKDILKSVVEEEKNKRYRVEGMSALIKFIRNKARLDIMKADEYGQGYYQAIKDMENYFGISEVDDLRTRLKEMEKGI